MFKQATDKRVAVFIAPGLEEIEGLTVVDFKTDRVGEADLMERAEAYRPQIEAYSRALEQIFQTPVTRRVLWFFRPGQAVEL